ncbi:MAG: hypothetical protein ACREWG_02275, partial [Gammaproteobacteria bacterium]
QGAGHHPRSALKKTVCKECGRAHSGWYDRKRRWVRDLSCGDTGRVYARLRRYRVLGETYFFTVNLLERRRAEYLLCWWTV